MPSFLRGLLSRTEHGRVPPAQAGRIALDAQPVQIVPRTGNRESEFVRSYDFETSDQSPVFRLVPTAGSSNGLLSESRPNGERTSYWLWRMPHPAV